MNSNNIFNKRSLKRRSRINTDRRRPRIPFLKLKPNESAIVRFISDEAVTFYQHYVYHPKLDRYVHITCIRDNCPLCKSGNRPRYVGAFYVVHLNNIEDGKTIPRVKVLVRGITDLGILEALNNKKPITSENIEITRYGSGQQTRYTFNFTGNSEVPEYEMPNISLEELFMPNLDWMKEIANSDNNDTSADDYRIVHNDVEYYDDSDDIPF